MLVEHRLGHGSNLRVSVTGATHSRAHLSQASARAREQRQVGGAIVPPWHAGGGAVLALVPRRGGRRHARRRPAAGRAHLSSATSRPSPPATCRSRIDPKRPFAPDIDYPALEPGLEYERHTLGAPPFVWAYRAPRGWPTVEGFQEIRWRPADEREDGGFSLRVKRPTSASRPRRWSSRSGRRCCRHNDDVFILGRTQDLLSFSYRDPVRDRLRFNIVPLVRLPGRRDDLRDVGGGSQGRPLASTTCSSRSRAASLQQPWSAGVPAGPSRPASAVKLRGRTSPRCPAPRWPSLSSIGAAHLDPQQAVRGHLHHPLDGHAGRAGRRPRSARGHRGDVHDRRLPAAHSGCCGTCGGACAGQGCLRNTPSPSSAAQSRPVPTDSAVLRRSR